MTSSRAARSDGLHAAGCASAALRARWPIDYVIRPGIDAAPGHAMIFAKFSEVMDFAEHQFLHGELEPGFPIQVLANLQVVERETYYYGTRCTGVSRTGCPTS